MQRSITLPSLRITALFMLLLLCAGTALALENQPIVLTIDQPQTAGISGFRALWDTPVVLSAAAPWSKLIRDCSARLPRAVWSPATTGEGCPTRRAGLRCGASQPAGAVPRHRGANRRGTRAKDIPFKKSNCASLTGTELWPEGYDEPGRHVLSGRCLGKKYSPLACHRLGVAQAVAGGPAKRPDYNAYINGAGYWKRIRRAGYRAGPLSRNDSARKKCPPIAPDGRVDVTAHAHRPRLWAYAGRSACTCSTTGFSAAEIRNL